ncbi:MAG: YceI family protein [Dehalococcoidia bacterium]|nr:YceI family protein [Dehalococcoidia bacterium]
MVAALIAAGIGALVASGLSLPLHSPDDVMFNTATITAGALVAGALAGAAWSRLGAGRGRVQRFVALLGAAFAIVALGAVAGESQFERTVAWVVPVAAVVLGSIAVFTPLLARMRPRPLLAGAVLLPAVLAGVALAGQGDAESGRLELPAASTAAAGSSGRFRTAADVRGVTFTVGAGSAATFSVNEKLTRLPLPNDAVLHTQALAGTIHLDGRPSTVTVDVLTLSSDQRSRDEFVRERLFPPHQLATFTFTDIGGLPASYTPGDVVRRRVQGTLNVRGVDGPLAFDIDARIDGDTLYALARTTLRWADFRLPAPNIAGLVEVAEEIRVEVLISARASTP